MAWSWRREAILLVPVVAMFITSAVAWPFAEEPFPVHWDAAGEADRYGGKFEGLMVLPIVALGTAVLMVGLPFVDPGRRNYASFLSTYNLIRGATLLFLAGLHVLLVSIGLGADLDITLFIYPAIGLLFLVLGNVMSKIRPNFFAGIRTPWTLSSARSWTATHRLGGWMFMAIGVGFLAMAIVQAAWFLIALLVANLTAIVLLFAYSYVVWRDDPDRVPVSQTTPTEPSP